MSGYLLDTDAISAFAPARKPVSETFSNWVAASSNALFISTISIGEIEAGLAKLRRKNEIVRAERLGTWFSTLLALQADRVLNFDRAIAHVYGETLDRAWAAGHDPGFADAAIAATAIQRGMSVVTYNVRHYAHFGVRLIDPRRPETFV